MTQGMHCLVAIILFNITFHFVLKKTPFMQEALKKGSFRSLYFLFVFCLKV